MIVIYWLISTALWLSLWLPFYITGFVFTLLGLLGRSRDAEHMWLPFWLWDSNAGINGTLNGMNLNWVLICNPGLNGDLTKAAQIVANKEGNERKYWNRWKWIAFRNPVTNLSRWILGVSSRNYTTSSWGFGPLSVVIEHGGWVWSYAFTLNYGIKRGFFYRFGWKLDDPQQGRCCFMYRISPWKAL